MNRSNVGNITTNAMQTLAISGTRFASDLRRWKSDALKRKKEDVSTTLNNSSNDTGSSGQQIQKPTYQYAGERTAENLTQKLNSGSSGSGSEVVESDFLDDKGDDFNEQVYQFLHNDLMLPSDSPQAEAIRMYVQRNAEWFEARSKRDWRK